MTAATSPIGITGSTEAARVVVLDATNWGHMLWHASRGDCDLPAAMLNRCRVLAEAWGAYQVVGCFDQGESFRRQLHPAYKAHRPATDERLRSGLAAAAELLVREGIPVLAGEQLEADDWIASVCRAAVGCHTRAIVVSADKDVRQCLVAGQVSIAVAVHVRHGVPETRWLTADGLQSQYGVGPELWIDYQCLVGDKTDGIVGAQGIGPKTAVHLLNLAGSLDRLLATPDAFTAQKNQLTSLRELRGRADLVRKLVTLRTDGPCAAEVL